MHVADIDFPTFYEEALGCESGAAAFVTRVRKLDANQFPGKLAIHQAARLLWLADRLEQYAKGRDALQILFYVIAAEAIAKLVRGYDGEGESKRHVRLFFEEDCSDAARGVLGRGFASGLGGPYLSLREAVDFLYRIRCDVAHKGRYFGYTLMGLSDTPNPEDFLVAHVGVTELRRIVLEGTLLAAYRALPTDSPCRELLHL